MYKFTDGNVSIWVEVRPYDGVCDHCGKTGIKYLAHVEQSVAATIKEGIEETATKVEYTAAMFSGKKNCVVQVGCVCVAKYLMANSVEANFATRLQKHVNSITAALILANKLNEARNPEKVDEFIAHWKQVRKLYERNQKLYAVLGDLYQNKSTDTAMIADVTGEHYRIGRILHSAQTRLSAEYFGIPSWSLCCWKNEESAREGYSRYIQRKTKKVEWNLSRYQMKSEESTSPDLLRRFA